MTIYFTNRFYKHLIDLQKNKSYAAVLDDICDYFSDKNIQELHQTRDIISNSSGTYSLHKFRVANSVMNKGKSASFRCIGACFVKDELIVLDTIYPKTGSDGIENLTKETYKEIATNIKDALISGSLYTLILSNKSFKKIL
ncbi:MAG: hypothetical protein JST26_01655 [Bacteroidetes bacterium]|nr:hypothetical protein [Bacteroidota bacterium]